MITGYNVYVNWHSHTDFIARCQVGVFDSYISDLAKAKGGDTWNIDQNNETAILVGVEITDDANPVSSFPFSGPTAFMMGNEGTGLNERQMRQCDSFVYIPQYGPGTASLNVAAAAAIVLHHYALRAGYKERERQGNKFVVGERPQRTAPRGCAPLAEGQVEALRAARRGGNGEGDGSFDALSPFD